MKWFSTAVMIAVLGCVEQSGGTDLEALKRPPVDSVDAQNVRVWLSLARDSRCRTAVTIVNLHGDTTRHLFSALMVPGYYNFYWDKLDDSGRFVDSGEYRYILNDCGSIRVGGRLRIKYKYGERACLFSAADYEKDGTMILTVLDDSVLVNLIIENRRGEVVDRPLVDSLMCRGRHGLHWTPPGQIRPGRYTVKLMVGEHLQTDEFYYRR
ncbi:MAG: hypothetical protein JSU65_07545 [Candidatus Zixiibacteriota bacterium]|nr:MAG: hypothetical protein JSU65_07545 [candidate division Zixibacteria bacterium]